MDGKALAGSVMTILVPSWKDQNEEKEFDNTAYNGSVSIGQG